jgi:hypothetical protein
MANDNVLAGMACPECHSEGPFEIACKTIATFDDNGIKDHGDMEWDNASSCNCEACGNERKVGDYMRSQSTDEQAISSEKQDCNHRK